MAIKLHPTKESPTSYRIQDKVLGIQEYFPFSRYGSMKNAHEAAKLRNKLIVRQREIFDKAPVSDIDKVFYKTGEVIGLRRGTRKGKAGNVADVLIAQITVDGRQVKTDRALTDGFWGAYNGIMKWILEKKGVDKTLTIGKMMRDCHHLYNYTSKTPT